MTVSRERALGVAVLAALLAPGAAAAGDTPKDPVILLPPAPGGEADGSETIPPGVVAEEDLPEPPEPPVVEPAEQPAVGSVEPPAVESVEPPAVVEPVEPTPGVEPPAVVESVEPAVESVEPLAVVESVEPPAVVESVEPPAVGSAEPAPAPPIEPPVVESVESPVAGSVEPPGVEPVESPPVVEPVEPPAVEPAAPPAAAQPAPTGGRLHRVEPGESLWRIAERLLGPRATAAEVAVEVDRLWRLNRDRIGTGDRDLLPAGVTIVLSGGA
jgi:hypothetical protein